MTRTMTVVDAGRLALAEAMRADPSVWVLGEDIGRGGVFGQYKGLQQEFGPERVLDTPISEGAIVGCAVGAALVGMRPVVEMRYADFMFCAMDELVNQAAKIRYMLGGQGRVPMVVRLPSGMWRNTAAQHSQTIESLFVHIPGLIVTAPATPQDAYDLMKAALYAGDPVVHVENKDLYLVEGPVDTAARPLPIGRARIDRPGRDATIVTFGGQLPMARRAAELSAADGVDVEVIDLRTLWPWDKGCVLESAARTGRCVVLQEAVLTASMASEVAATVADELFGRLKAPVRRLGSPRVPIPFAPPLEDQLKVTAEQVAAAVRALMR